MAEYLRLHPEMAHELMVPSGFKQCMVRRYERYLGGEKMLSIQIGAAEKARWDEEIFDAMLPGKPTVVSNPNNNKEPNWRELNDFVCRNGIDTMTGQIMAPHYEYRESGQRVRVISYRSMKGVTFSSLLNIPRLTAGIVEVTSKQWHLMWEHVVCAFFNPSSDKDIEFRALHEAFTEISSSLKPWHDWQFPIGQQIAILMKQLEHRLRAAHVGRPNPCSEFV